MFQGRLMKELIIWLGLLSCPALIFAVYGPSGMKAFDGASGTTQLERGRLAFERECASCHGPTGGGTENGPNLIAARYGPSEMADALIRGAVLNGMPKRSAAHPGMPALPQLRPPELDSILRFLREIQRANDIY